VRCSRRESKKLNLQGVELSVYQTPGITMLKLVAAKGFVVCPLLGYNPKSGPWEILAVEIGQDSRIVSALLVLKYSEPYIGTPTSLASSSSEQSPSSELSGACWTLAKVSDREVMRAWPRDQRRGQSA